MDNPYIYLFGVFFVFGLFYLYLLDQVRVRLSRDHRDLWADLSTTSLFHMDCIARFVFKRRDRSLNDVPLTRLTRWAARIGYLVFAAWIAGAFLFFSHLSRM